MEAEAYSDCNACAHQIYLGGVQSAFRSTHCSLPIGSDSYSLFGFSRVAYLRVNNHVVETRAQGTFILTMLLEIVKKLTPH